MAATNRAFLTIQAIDHVSPANPMRGQAPANDMRGQAPQAPDFEVLRMQCRERISANYAIGVEVVSPNPHLDLAALNGKPYGITLWNDHDDPERYFQGIAVSARLLQCGDPHSIYRLELAPAIELLKWRRNSRIFQNKTSADIVKQIFQEAGLKADTVRWVLQGNYPPRAYCVQYEETDLAFIQRLLAEEGMFYYFEHEATRHILVVAPAPPCAARH